MSHIGEAPTAAFALIGLLTGVGAVVSDKGATLNESLATAGDSVKVRTLVSMNSIIALKVRIALESLL